MMQVLKLSFDHLSCPPPPSQDGTTEDVMQQISDLEQKVEQFRSELSLKVHDCVCEGGGMLYANPSQYQRE